jgi:hypothetical protein
MSSNRKKGLSDRDRRRLRTQQIIFTVIAVIIIFTWVVGLVWK